MSRIAKSRYNPGNDFWIVKIKNTNFDALTGQTIHMKMVQRCMR